MCRCCLAQVKRFNFMVGGSFVFLGDLWHLSINSAARRLVVLAKIATTAAFMILTNFLCTFLYFEDKWIELAFISSHSDTLTATISIRLAPYDSDFINFIFYSAYCHSRGMYKNNNLSLWKIGMLQQCSDLRNIHRRQSFTFTHFKQPLLTS